MGRRLAPAKHSVSPFDRRNCDKAAQAAMFQLRRPFDESPFFLRVVREHLCS